MALYDDYFISRKLYPNVGFYTGLIYRAAGFPTRMFTVLFAPGPAASSSEGDISPRRLRSCGRAPARAGPRRALFALPLQFHGSWVGFRS